MQRYMEVLTLAWPGLVYRLSYCYNVLTALRPSQSAAMESDCTGNI